ncbi:MULTISPECIES: type I restriction endonuclease subunit R [Rodentibacter]|uniref:type I restriction endonuclease subunit R n=1 Tax=Rodentibacter TaxID=1960084 RepID=UPI001CFE3588|nr:type I restriction endonuclease subunit R [Rodentibacter sp. JRC1]GJI55168.1 putative type I restriction enzyme HindVIIP R protein [Rodentibacter sp. JRC1]
MQINEAVLEQSAIEKLQAVGWQYVHGKTILEGLYNPWRERTSAVIFEPILRQAVERLNPQLPMLAVDQVLSKVRQIEGRDLLEKNQTVYDFLRNGVPVVYQQNGEQKHDVALLLDFQAVENNHFLLVNQLDIQGSKGKRIPDLIGYVNGLPLMVCELKNPLNIEADLTMAWRQLQTYKEEIADLFIFNQLLVISDGITARIGSLSAPFERFTPWRVVDEKQNSLRIPFEQELDAVINGVLLPEVLLDYVQNFVVFESNEKGKIIKKSAAYHQYYGVNEALDCTLIASGEQGDRKIGVMWHTQGSGKSLSMLFYAGKLLAQKALKNPTIVVVTDRNDLDGQLYQTFCAGFAVLKQTPVQADGREALRQALNSREAGGVIFTTIQKFGLLDGEDRHPVLNIRENIIVISDEAHRSQYGFSQKLNAKGEYRTGYAQYLRHALPNASFIGFTGTPIEAEDKDTQAVFGRYVSIYDFEDAVIDGATVPIFYEARQISLGESHEFDEVVREAEQIDENEQGYKFRIYEELVGNDQRLERLAADFVYHFEQRLAVVDGKVMIVAMSRAIAVKLFEKITALRPDWASDEVTQGAIKIVMTSSANDEQSWQRHNQDKKTLERRFKDPDDPLKIVIVRDMWLTGFDAPCCHTMYIDKPMKGHNLMQAIARVNRVFHNKSRENGGLIVDYIGLTEELKEAKRQYTNAGGKGSDVKHDVEAVFAKLREHISIIRGQFATPVQGRAVEISGILQLSDPNALLNGILQAANHILALDQHNPEGKTPRKNAFLETVRLAKKGLSLCGALPETEPYKAELAFYDAVRATIVKNSTTKESTTGKSDKQLKLTEWLNRAITSDGVVDLFDLLHKDRPNISLLSDEFLSTVKQSAIPNLWLSAVEKYLKAEIRERSIANLATQKTFEQRLKEAMNRYHNQQLSVIEILEELVQLAKDFQQKQAQGEMLGLSQTELAFYDALAQNESAVNLLGDVVLVQLAKELTDLIRRSVTIDWQYKDAVRARMRIFIQRLLRQYKYPPDLQREAIEFVIQQAEVIGEEWNKQ